MSKYGNLTMANSLITCCSRYLIIESRDNQGGFHGHHGLSEDGLECFFSDGELISDEQTSGSPSGSQRRKKRVCNAGIYTLFFLLHSKEADVKALLRRGSVSRNGFKVEKSIKEPLIWQQITSERPGRRQGCPLEILPRAISQEKKELKASRLKRRLKTISIHR